MEENINHGVLDNALRPVEEREKDHIAGAETTIKFEERVVDWNSLLPVPIDQYNPSPWWDTNACTHFAANQSIEGQIKWLYKSGKLSQEAMNLVLLYCKDKNIDTFETSKRFNAILGGNTPQGNYFQKAWDSPRNDGLIPESMLDSRPSHLIEKTPDHWHAYHNPSLITQEMRDMGKKFLTYFVVAYDWVENTPTSRAHYIKQAPLNIGVPKNVSHSIISTREDGITKDTFEHYGEPYLRVNDPREVGLVMRGVVTPITKNIEIKPSHIFLNDLTFGQRSDEVRILQQCLIYLGFLKKGMDTGYYGTYTKQAVLNLQTAHADEILKPAGLTVGTGNCRKFTRAFINKIFS